MVQFWLFISIACLNMTDALATAYGLKLGIVDEQNPFAQFLWDIDSILFLVVKLAMSLIILYFPFFTRKKIWKKRFWTITLSLVIFIYIITNSVHIFWLSIHFNLITF